MSRRISALLVIVVLVGLLLYGWNQDLRPLPGGYSLERNNDAPPTIYYVKEPGPDKGGGGVFDGAIEEIGWNDDWIVARVKRIYWGDPNGWYVLKVKTREMTGPFEETQLKLDPALSSIEPMRPEGIFSGKK